MGAFLEFIGVLLGGREIATRMPVRKGVKTRRRGRRSGICARGVTRLARCLTQMSQRWVVARNPRLSEGGSRRWSGPALHRLYCHPSGARCAAPPREVPAPMPEGTHIQLELRRVVCALNIAALKRRVLSLFSRAAALSFQRHSVMRGRGTLGATLVGRACKHAQRLKLESGSKPHDDGSSLRGLQ